MEFIEYPKRIDDEKIVNSQQEEIEYLKNKGIGVIADDKKQESTTGVLKRKAGRPKRV